MACVELLPLCSIPKMATRDGLTGANAYMNLIPDVGMRFASGQVVTFPNAAIPQDNSRTYQGTWKPNTFTKGFTCSVPAVCPA